MVQLHGDGVQRWLFQRFKVVPGFREVQGFKVHGFRVQGSQGFNPHS
jgi:hypothetical protein